MTAVNRITNELGIGARKITVSTVGIVPNIRKLTHDPDMPQVRLAVSLHCADDEERTALLPANRRNGGLAELMQVLREYIATTGRRVTLEWALIAGENDNVATARKLGRLLVHQSKLRPDMLHVNVIPLNPTAAYGGMPSNKGAVNLFCDTLVNEFGIACTPRVRRGIDIDAGCGQLTTAILQKQHDTAAVTTTATAAEPKRLADFMPASSQQLRPTSVGVYDDDDDGSEDDAPTVNTRTFETNELLSGYALDGAVDVQDFDDDVDFEDPDFDCLEDKREANRLISLIQGTTINLAALDGDKADGTVVVPRKKAKSTKPQNVSIRSP